MNIEYINEYVHLANSLSFRRTAEHFFVSRSVISRHLAALEESLGAVLLERNTRGVELTEAGTVFLQEARVLLRDWELAREHVHAVSGKGDKLVRIGYLRNGARPFLVEFVKSMTRNHPEVHLSLLCMSYRDICQALEEHTIDIALGISVEGARTRSERSTLIYEDCFVVACSRAHPLSHLKDGVTPEDLRDQRLIVPDSYLSAGLETLVSQLVDEASLAEAEGLYEDMDLLYLKIQTEERVAFVSRLNAAMFEEPLAILPIRGMDTTFAISAYYHDDLAGSAFEYCRDEFEECRRALADRPPAIPRW